MKSLATALFALGSGPALAQAADPHAGHHMPAMDAAAPAAPMPGIAMPAAPADSTDPTGTDQAPGSAEAPAVIHDSPADRYWDPAAMAAAREAEMHPPKPVYSKLIFDLAEYQAREGRDGYHWEGEAWLGDWNRFVVKSRGEGTVGAGIDQAEFQALYSRALDPWWNLQAGVRQDVGPGPNRTWATVGVEGRARYQFEVTAAAFLSDKGQLAARLEGAFDQRITQRLILQPRAEFELAAQDMPDQRIGAGLSTAEFGLRLRYQIRPELSPYVGVNWTWAAGRTADYARADGKDIRERAVVAGMRVWF